VPRWCGHHWPGNLRGAPKYIERGRHPLGVGLEPALSKAIKPPGPGDSKTHPEDKVLEKFSRLSALPNWKLGGREAQSQEWPEAHHTAFTVEEPWLLRATPPKIIRQTESQT